MKDGDISSTGYVAGIRPTLGSEDEIHLIWNDVNQLLYYMVFNMRKGDNKKSKLLYENVLLFPMRATFVGTQTESDQGITFY